MVFYSEKSRQKVFHLSHCKIIRRISKENRKQFATPEMAREAGYRLCDWCSPVGARVRKEKQAIDAFCRENGSVCCLKDDRFHIRMPHSQWIVSASGKGHKLFLYHKNTYKKPKMPPSEIPGYHAQAVRRDTVMEYLNYIARHDVFRQKKTAEKKREIADQKNKMELRRNTRKFRRGKTNKKFSANQLYSVLEELVF